MQKYDILVTLSSPPPPAWQSGYGLSYRLNVFRVALVVRHNGFV